MTHPRLRQRGSTLIVSLIMLILLTILALSTLNVGRSSLQISGNTQAQAVTQSAAQQIINQVISNRTFAETPTNVLDNTNCPATYSAPANSRCVDVNGDGKTVVLVSLSPTPACIQSRPIPTNELNLFVAEDLGCTVGLSNQNYGVAGASALNSLCSNTMWEITAVASDPVTGAQSSVTQGVTVRVSTDSVATSCP
jgi:Tfp pilus assembly protein PilX